VINNSQKYRTYVTGVSSVPMTSCSVQHICCDWNQLSPY